MNFSYSKTDYEQLTLTEKLFIQKEWERKIVRDSEILNQAVANAVGNVLRKKGKKARKLWNKNPKRTDREEHVHAMKIVLDIENEQGKNWIAKIKGKGR